jgi:Ala-tRNA(Pro) deacylase
MAQWGCKIKRYSRPRPGRPGAGCRTWRRAPRRGEKVGLASPFNAICVSLTPINALMFSRRPGSGTLSQNTGAPAMSAATAEPTTRADLFSLFEALAIDYQTVEHRPVFTVDEGRDLKVGMPGGHSKNLFLKDKKGALYLAVAWCDTAVDLVGLGKALGSKGRLSFGKPELMRDTLGVIPGAVTPFALVNETARALREVVLDRALLQFERVWFHPLENTATTGLKPEDLLKFIRHCGFEPRLIELCAPLAADA